MLPFINLKIEVEAVLGSLFLGDLLEIDKEAGCDFESGPARCTT